MSGPTIVSLATPAGVQPSRRTVLRGTLGVAGGVLLAGWAHPSIAQNTSTRGAKMPGPATSYFAYVGCRTSRERNARGDGINVFKADATTDQWTHVQLVPDLVNPSFLQFDRERRF